MNDRPLPQLEELLIDRATGDLDAEGEARFAEMFATEPGATDDTYELLVAEMTAAMLEQDGLESMPESVAAAILEGAQDRTAPVDISPATHRAPRASWPTWSGWLLAAAALIGWLVLPGLRTPAGPPPEPTVAQIRDALVSGGSAVQLAWTATEDPAAAGASGEVVWSTAEQAGVMTFSGLEANDPSISQYQLWIFDATRDDRFPVDGGVFDVVAGQDVLIEIQAKIGVREPSLFAITVEQPGGVVVSDRERIVLVAQAD